MSIISTQRVKGYFAAWLCRDKDPFLPPRRPPKRKSHDMPVASTTLNCTFSAAFDYAGLCCAQSPSLMYSLILRRS
jgi:hypothetical protein